MTPATDTRAWDVCPIETRMAWILPAVVAAAGLVAVVATARTEPAALAWLLPILALVAAILWLSWVRRSVTTGGGMLRVRAGVHSHTVPFDAIDADAARIVDLDERTELRPFVKTFGSSMPGLQMGHFRLRDRGRAFVLLTARRKVLLLPVRDGRRILLSLQQPQALVDAIRAARAASRR